MKWCLLVFSLSLASCTCNDTAAKHSRYYCHTDQDCASGFLCLNSECLSADNDCNGLTDCADPFCAGKTCAPNGFTCVQNNCKCTPPGVYESVEASCADGVDNDCNGLTDCADPSCAGKICQVGYGRSCVNRSCAYPCRGYGLSCTTASQCCSQVCDQGLCAPVPDAGTVCGASGAQCSAATDCCTNFCLVDAGVCSDDPTFGSAQGCLPDGGDGNVCYSWGFTPLISSCGDPCVRDICRQFPPCCSGAWSNDCAVQADQNCWHRCSPP